MTASKDIQTPIEVVAHHQLALLEKDLASKRGDSPGQSENWDRFHLILFATVRKYAKVGDDPKGNTDFYHGGDRSHELVDCFAMRSTRAISPRAFRKLQSVVSAHHPDASLTLNGESKSPVDGLEVLITATNIYLAWKGRTPEACKQELDKLGVDLDAGFTKMWWEFWK